MNTDTLTPPPQPPAPHETESQCQQGPIHHYHHKDHDHDGGDSLALVAGTSSSAEPSEPPQDDQTIVQEQQLHQEPVGVVNENINSNVNEPLTTVAAGYIFPQEQHEHEHEHEHRHEQEDEGSGTSNMNDTALLAGVGLSVDVDMQLHKNGHEHEHGHEEDRVHVTEIVNEEAHQIQHDVNEDTTVVEVTHPPCHGHGHDQRHEAIQVHEQQHQHQHEHENINVNLAWDVDPGSSSVSDQVQIQVEQIPIQDAQVVHGHEHQHQHQHQHGVQDVNKHGTQTVIQNDTYQHVIHTHSDADGEVQSGIVEDGNGNINVNTCSLVGADADVQYYQESSLTGASNDSNLALVAGTSHAGDTVGQEREVMYQAVQEVEEFELQQGHEISQHLHQHLQHQQLQEEHLMNDHMTAELEVPMVPTPQAQTPSPNEQLQGYDHEHVAAVAATAAVSQPALEPQSQPPSPEKGTIATKATKEDQWNEMFGRLEAFKAENNHTMVPKRYAKDPKLGTWIETQRVQFRKLWKATGQNDDLLHSNTATNDISNGHANAHVDADADAGSAPVFDPTMYVTPNARLTADRLRRLQAVGFAWTVRKRKSNPVSSNGVHASDVNGNENGSQGSLSTHGIETNSNKRKNFLDIVGQHVDETGMQCHHDGQDHIHGILHAPKKQKKNDIQWNEMYQRLVQYKSVHGNCLVPKGFTEDPKLACWVETQRHLHSKYYSQSEHLHHENGEAVAAGSESQKSSIRLTKERKDRLDAIDFVWSLRSAKMGEHWEEMYAALVDYRQQHGDCLVPSRYNENTRLSRWVETMRAEYSKLERMKESASTGKSSSRKNHAKIRLTPSRIQRLEAVGFEWRVKNQTKGRAKDEIGEVSRVQNVTASTVSRVADHATVRKPNNDKLWNEMFECLKQYKEVHGHTRVPKRWKENKQLGCWVDTQRVQYKKRQQLLEKEGGATTKNLRLTDERIERLESLGFIWSIRDDWQKHYTSLLEYRAENGHCNVPARYPLNNRLGIWVVSQRQQYKYLKQIEAGTIPPRSIPLTQKRIEMLDEVGFSWSLRSSESVAENWQQRYAELCEYRAQYGHCNVPSRYEANRSLAAWCGLQRTNHRQYMKAKEQGLDVSGFAMNDERIQKLEELEFEFSIRTPETTWKKRLEELRAFKLEYGMECAVPSNFKANPRLGIFAQTQRAQRILYEEGRPSTLDAQKIMELDALGFFWNVEDHTENVMDDQGDEIIDAHVIHHPHNEIYHSIVELETVGHDHEHEDPNHAHSGHHPAAHMPESEEIQVQEPEHADYDRNLPLIQMEGDESFQPTYNLGQVGALSMAADIAAAAVQMTGDGEVSGHDQLPDGQEEQVKTEYTAI